MNNLHIENSYNIWKISAMHEIIDTMLAGESIKDVLNRNYASLYIEWWLHNIGYYITKPLCNFDKILALNLRFKDVDLNEWGRIIYENLGR